MSRTSPPTSRWVTELPQPIRGYRDLSTEDLEIIDQIKQLEQQVGALWKKVGIRFSQSSELESIDYMQASRWMSIAKTHMQEGFSAFVRAVARPEEVF